MNYFDGVGIGMQTLVGVYSDGFPYKHGNCFSILTKEWDKGKAMECFDSSERIVNFYVENLEELIKRGLTYPIKCAYIGEDKRVAIICDPRINNAWYSDRFCETCTPSSLLPITQKIIHTLDELRGNTEVIPPKKEGDIGITIHKIGPNRYKGDYPV